MLLPVAIFTVFLLTFLGVGHLAAQRLKPTDEDYLLGSRSFGRFCIGLSAGATGNSGFIMTAAVGLGYTMGLSALLLGIGFFIGEYLFWTLFSERVNKIAIAGNAQTVPEMLGGLLARPIQRRRITQLVAAISLVLVGAYAAAQFSAAGKTLNAFFGWSSEAGAALAAAVIVFYCVSGGLRASIWTDIVQAFVVIAVSFGMLALALYAGGGPAVVAAKLREIDPDLMHLFAGHTFGSAALYLFGFAVMGFSFTLSQPPVMVRLLAGKSPQEVRAAKWIYLGFIYSTWGIMTLFGVCTRVLLPDLADPEQALPLYAVQALHPALVGLVLAGVFSVIVSTADSQILVCSSAFGRDLHPRLCARLSSRYGVRWQQFSTLVVGLASLAAAVYISSTVFTMVLFAVGVLAGSIGTVMLVMLLGIRTRYAALISTIIGGLIATVACRLSGWNASVNEVIVGIAVGFVVHEISVRIAREAPAAAGMPESAEKEEARSAAVNE